MTERTEVRAALSNAVNLRQTMKIGAVNESGDSYTKNAKGGLPNENQIGIPSSEITVQAAWI